MKAIWRAWKGFSHKLISAQNKVLMAIVYITAVAPLALVFKVFTKGLVQVPPADDEARDSYFDPKPEPSLDMERAQRMF